MADLTPTTTRREYLTTLARSYLDSAPHGGNRAVLHHMRKVQDMTDDEWIFHRAERLEANANPSRAEAVRQMAAELFAKLPPR